MIKEKNKIWEDCRREGEGKSEKKGACTLSEMPGSPYFMFC